MKKKMLNHALNEMSIKKTENNERLCFFFSHII